MWRARAGSEEGYGKLNAAQMTGVFQEWHSMRNSYLFDLMIVNWNNYYVVTLLCESQMGRPYASLLFRHSLDYVFVW